MLLAVASELLSVCIYDRAFFCLLASFPNKASTVSALRLAKLVPYRSSPRGGSSGFGGGALTRVERG